MGTNKRIKITLTRVSKLGDRTMISPNELAQRIESTTLPEAIELFKEKILKIDISECNDFYKPIVQAEYEQIDYEGDFFFFVEPHLGSSRGGFRLYRPRARKSCFTFIID